MVVVVRVASLKFVSRGDKRASFQAGSPVGAQTSKAQ